MNVKHKSTGRATSMGAGLAAGTAVSLGLTLSGSMLCSWLILSGRMNPQSIGYCSMILILLSSLLGPICAAALIRHRRLYVCVFTAALYYSILLAINALFFGGQYQGMGVTALLVVAGCGVSILTGMGQGRRFNKHNVKIPRR